MHSSRNTIGRPLLRGCCLLCIGFSLSAPPTRSAVAAEIRAAGAEAPTLADGIRVFQRGFEAGDPEGLEQAMAIFAGACASRPDDFDAHYWRSAASLALALRSRSPTAEGADGRGSDDLVQQAEDAALAALEIREQSGEVHAHLATALGLRIAQRPSSAVWRGGRLRRHARRALALEPGNPRVLFLLGTGQARAPSPWGNPDRALTDLLKAEQLFAAEEQTPATAHAPRWGYCHALHAIADLYVAKGLTGPAQRYRDRAVARCPLVRRTQPAAQGTTEAPPP